MTQAEALKQITEDHALLDARLIGYWDYLIQSPGCQADLDALARLVALAKKGAEREV